MTEDMIHAVLESLGSTSDEVAATLLAMGCKGTQCDGCGCPVAKALERAFPGESPSVDAEEVDVGPFSVATTKAVGEFVSGFDLGHYQELVA